MKRSVTQLLFVLACVGCNGKDKDAPVDKPKDKGPDDIVDIFTQEMISPVDILWAVDGGWGDGLSALQDMEVLQSLFETMLTADPSWRMGVMSTNTTGASFGLIGTKWETYPPPGNAFSPPPSSSAPRVRDAIYTTLELRKETSANAEFLRSDAHLYVVVYTNDEDDSTEVSQGDFNDWFADFTPSTTKRIGAITSSDRKEYWENKVVDGIVADVGSFRKALDRVMWDAMGLRTEFTLSRIPNDIPEEITYIHREQPLTLEIDADYTYDEGSQVISLTDLVPLDGDEIVVGYESDKVKDEK